MPRIGKVARVLVLEKRKPKLVVPCQRITQKSCLGPHGCSSPHPNGVGIVTTKDWDAGRGTQSSTDYHGHLAVLRNESRQQRDGVLAPTTHFGKLREDEGA